MKIVTDKYLYICSVVCGLFLVYFISLYILLVIVVFISFLYYVSHPTSSLKLRTVNLLSNLWHSSSFLTSFDSMNQQNSLATYRLHRNRTFSNSRRSPNTLSSRENDTENMSFGAYSCEYDSEGFAYRSSDETSFNNLKMNSPTPNGSFNISRRSTSSNSPWGVSVSPMLRNRTSDVKTVQTVAGPLLAATRFNRSLDSGLLGNVSSPGLSSRIAHSARENAEVLTHQKKYDRPGDFPLVQLDRSASRLQTLSPRNTHKLTRRSVTVRIAPPESSELRYSALLDRSPQSFGGMDHDTSPTAEMSTKSLLEVLKEISRKRIHAQMEENEGIKRQCKGETSLANGEQQSRLTPVLNDVSGCKRMREESPEEQNVEQMNHQSRKRINNNNNEILSSLSSSRNLLKFMKKSAKKRKLTAELLANSAPVAKKQSRLESPSDSVPVSASDTASNCNKQNTSSVDTVNSLTSSSKNIAITVTSSPTKMFDSAKFSEAIQMKSFEKSSLKFLCDEEISQQRMKILIESIENGGLATNTRSARFSLSRAPTVPVRRIPIFSEEKVAESTKITPDDSKTSNTEVQDSNISITKSPSSANVFGLVSSVPNTTLHNTSSASVVSVSASASIAQTSTIQCTSSATPVQSSSPFSGLTSPTLVASSLSTSLKTSADQSTANSEQPTTKTGISISQSFVTSTSTSNTNAQTFPISLPIQSSMITNFGATQTTAAVPNSLSSVKSSLFAISSAEQLIQTSGFGSTTNAPSNGTSVVQVSAVSSNNSNNNNNKSAEMRKPSSPQLIFGAVSSAKDTVAIGSPQAQSTQAATLFSSSQVQSTQASSLFGSSPLAQSTQFNSPQVQSAQATIVFGSATSTQSNPVFPVSNSSIQATTESGFTASQPSVPPKSLFSVPQTSQQIATGGMFPSVQSSALFRTSPTSSSSSLQPQSALSFGGSATTEAAQTSVFGSKQTDLFKTSANQSVQGGKLFGISSSLGVQPAQTVTVFSSSPAGTTIQASVFGNSGTTQTTAGSNMFVSTSAVSSTQSEVKFGINAQSSTLQTKSSFVLPSASIAFGSSVSPAQNASGFQIAKPTSQTDSGVGTSASSTASSGFGSVSSKPSPAQNTFAFGGATPSSAASQTTSIFGTPTLQVTPKSSTQTSLSFGTSTSQSSGTFSTPQSGTAISGGFGAFSGSLAKTTTKSNAATGKNLFASTASAANNTPVFGTQTTNAINVFGGTKTDEKPAPFGFGSAKSNDSSTNIFQSNTTSNQSNVAGFKFDFLSPSTTKENTAGTSSGQTTTPAFQFGAPGESKPAFGFGGASSINNTLKPASGAFGSNLFGSTPITTSSTTPQSNVFAFGGAANPSSGSAGSTNNAFGFGAASSAPSTSGAFTFGSTSQPSSSNVFGFGSAQTTTSTAQNVSGGGGLFNTGTAQNASGGGGLFNTGTVQNASGGGGLFNTGTAQNASGGAGLFNTGTAQNAPGGGGLFNTGTPPAFQFGNAPTQAGSTGSFGFGNAGSATPVNFAAGPSSSSSTFQPGTTGNMFSIGSGSTGPRARTRTSRRQR